ncbi:MAG: flagellar basal body protein [Acidobacteriia bacterium]|nr:flagellar basal body protein [Terriglobia bacterium]
MSALEHYLDLLAFRQQLTTSNVANVDTPGYQTRDIDFRAEMQRALASDAKTAPSVRSVPGLIERPDGNNVSLDREGLALARIQLQFHVGVQLLREQFHQLQIAINEGK